jgi:CRISPR-associated endonuclease/helicase Cas3
VDHCIDVAFTFRRIAAIPAIRRRLAVAAEHPLTDQQLDRLAVIALLHDIGKCNRGFQAKQDPTAKDTAGHVLEGAALLVHDELQDLWPPSLRVVAMETCEWFDAGPNHAQAMWLAAISHHGRPISFADIDGNPDRSPERWWRAKDGVDPMRAIDELLAGARQAFPAAFVAGGKGIDATSALQQRFAGLVMLADWVGSDTVFFPYRVDDAEDRVALARGAANRAVAGIGLEPPGERTPASFAETFGFQPSPLQQALAEELEVDEGSRLVLIESDTGSGKTEAALAWYLRLLEAGEVDGLYFALPTRVAARELYGRIRRAIECAFPNPDHRPGPVLLAAPGYARVDGEPRALPSPEGRLWEDDVELRRHERQWAAEHPKRFLAAPVAVGTIDQALLSVLRVKHALLRSVCLDRSLLVVDEVHASDPYMRQTLQCLIAGHLRRGGRALLLSATLGESASSTFFDRSLLALDEAQRRPYPSLSTRGAERPIAPRGDAKRVTFEFIEGMDDADALAHIAQAVADGARVLVVCNTVSRANALLRAADAHSALPRDALFTVAGEVCPHHGRFSREHREVMDAAVSAALGKGSAAGARLLVGTQTLEQSLDIDADLLVSDLCPMDVLLQRIGRLHRHHRDGRPARYAAPRVLLRVPESGDLRRWLRADGSLRAPAGLGAVYPDGRVLQRTLDLLRTQPVIQIPADNRRLVEQTTHPEAWQELPPEWQMHGARVEGEELAQIRAALTSTIEDLPFGELHYAAPDERVATRLGAGNLDLKLAQPMSQPFGMLVRSVGIPAHMARGIRQPPDSVVAEAFNEGFRFTLGERRYRYTRYGLEIDDA